MLSWPPTVKIFLGADPTDMRKGFDSLAHLVESSMALDPLSGHLFVFRSRGGDRIKVLWWDKDGYFLWSVLSGTSCISGGQTEQPLGGGLNIRLGDPGAKSRTNLLLQQGTPPRPPLVGVARAAQRRVPWRGRAVH